MIVVVVKDYFEKFIWFWLMVVDFVVVFEEDVMKVWVGLGYYLCVCNLKKCVDVIVVDYGGCFLDIEVEFLKLLGIGFYIVVVIVVIVFDCFVVVVDGNVECVFMWLVLIEMLFLEVKLVIKVLMVDLILEICFGDFVQVVMDLGVIICILKRLVCVICFW